MPSRRTYLAAVLTRFERGARGRVKRLHEHPLGFWVAVAVAASGLTVFTPKLIGVPWWAIPSVLAALAIVGVVEAAYRVWRDLEEAVAKRPGLELSGGVSTLTAYPIENTGAVYLSFSRRNEEARTVRVPNEDRAPTKVRFREPVATAFFSADDLPECLRVRDGLRRHYITVHRFVPGGFVLDDRDTPFNAPLRCEVYFPSREES